MGFEDFVRPFELPTNTPPMRLEMPGQVDAQIIRLQIGIGGGGRTMSGSMSYNETYYCVKYQNEVTDT